jgi:hypothetical protein
MNTSPLVNVISQRLREAGYMNIETPFKVATVNFEFTKAMRGVGGRSLDLILLIDTSIESFGDRDAARVRQRLQALSRALDVTGSRFVITVILAGDALTGDIEALTETCRVLHVETLALSASGSLIDQAAHDLLEDRIRILLPLELPDQKAQSSDGGRSVMELVSQALPEAMDKTLLNAVVTASQHGDQSVAQTLAQVFEQALQIKEVK